MTGQTLGHYRILEKIGAGGMGEVYRAHDEKLDRDVALKVLPASSFSDPAARARLLREARSAAGLNHPHICTIHEVGEAEGQAYIAMELVEGQALNARLIEGPLPTEQVLRFGLQLAEALGHAHERGIIHRDLKSANVVITAEGRAKVLDFGLAKRISEVEIDEATRSQASLTAPGAIVGTLAYMAPEQLRGQPAEARSDVWALGVVLYEMATGSRPFQGRTGFELSSAILSQQPVPLLGRVPVKLRAVIERCLEKEPGQRYQRGGEVHAALQAVQTGAVVPGAAWRLGRRHQATAWPPWAQILVAALGIPFIWGIVWITERAKHEPGSSTQVASAPRIESLAVLPLENLSRNPEQEYFADGMTEALIAELSTISGLKVISRTSVMQYKGARKPLPEIAGELKVEGIVEGSVTREGEQVRITVQLIHAATDRHLWSQSYTREAKSVLALQGEVARAIADHIRVQVSPRESRLATAESKDVNPEAFDLYLRGRSLASRWDNMPRACELFQQATEKDPNFAPAHGARATCLIQYANLGFRPPKEVFPVAQQAALRARELDPDHMETVKALFSVNFSILRDYHGAEKLIRRQLDGNPSDATSFEFLSELLSLMGRHDEAIAAGRKAVELSPRSYDSHLELGRMLYYGRRYQEAIAQLNAAIEIDPNGSAAYSYLSFSYDMLGRHDAALPPLQKNYVLFGDPPEVAAELGKAYARGGVRARLLVQARYAAQVTNQKKMYYGDAAMMYALLGEKDKAFQWLEKGYEEYDSIIFRIQDPAFDSLRDDPRWKTLLTRLHLHDTPLASLPAAPPLAAR